MANEVRLIIDALKKYHDSQFTPRVYEHSIFGKAALLLEADAVEVVHGRWNTEKCDHVPWRIKNPGKWVIYKCSVCGYSNGRKNINYCPNCGAKMDGDGDGS